MKNFLAKYKIIITGLIFGILVTLIELFLFENHDFSHELHEILVFIITLGFIFTISVIFQYYTRRQISSVQMLRESEEKFAKAFLSSPNILAITRMEDGILIDISEGFTRALGYKREEIVGLKVSELDLWIKDIDRIKFIRAIREEHEVLEYETQLRAKSGEIHIILISGTIITLNNEPHLITIAIDISDLKNAEQKLKESEEKFRTIAEQSSAGFVIIQGSRMIYLNNAIQKIFGYSPEELTNISIIDILKLVHPEDRANALDRFNKREKGVLGDSSSDHLRINSKSGEIKWVEVYSEMFQFQEKNTIFVTIVDITKERMVEIELQQLNQLKSEFLRRASHELKTPLISIKGYSDLILSLYTDQLDSEIISHLNEISHGCERLQYIINDLLKSSRLESIELKSNLQKEDLTFLIRYCVKEMESMAKKRKQSIKLNIHDQLYVNIEKEEIHDVLSNLLSNAIKYTPPNGEIELKTDLKDGFVLISVIDNGIGFTEEQKEKVFKQFGKIERYGQGIDLGIDGTGLGLYISKKIVESYGGKIWLESKGFHKGSTFYFTLPTT